MCAVETQAEQCGAVVGTYIHGSRRVCGRVGRTPANVIAVASHVRNCNHDCDDVDHVLTTHLSVRSIPNFVIRTGVT